MTPTPTTPVAVAAASPTVATAPATPDLKLWLTPAVLTLILHAPKNPMIRGMLRNDQHLVLPPEIDTTKKITEWLKANYGNSLAFKEGRTIDPARAASAVPRGVTLAADGSMTIDALQMRGRESGVVQYSCATVFTGRVIVPAVIVRGGWELVRQWLTTNADAISALQMSTENYEHRNFSVETQTRELYSGLTAEGFAALVFTPHQ